MVREHNKRRPLQPRSAAKASTVEQVGAMAWLRRATFVDIRRGRAEQACGDEAHTQALGLSKGKAGAKRAARRRRKQGWGRGRLGLGG